MSYKAIRGALACASLFAIASVSTQASAQQVDRIVAFGDSYADTGNLFHLINIAPPAVYPNGRFSNGTNFVDTMSKLLNVPDDNFAIGGAFTGNGNINGPGIPGFVTEYQSFLAGGGPATFPRVSGKFNPNDLLVISIGGNDARAYERALGVTPTAAQITTLLAGVPGQAALKVAEATTGLNALVNAGAKNITFLAGDVGRLPEVNGLPVAQVGTAYSGAFNAGMQTTLAGYASHGVIVNYLDLNKIGDVVAANLSAFGLQSAGACPVACVTTDFSLLDKYLFYVDNVHLTSAGFAIVGRYAVRQLAAPLTLQAPSDLGLDTAKQWGRTLSSRSDLYRGTAPAGVRLFAVGDLFQRDVPESQTNDRFEIRGGGGTIGAEFGMPGATVGVAANYSRPQVRFGNDSAKINGHSWQIGAYGNFDAGGVFAQGHLGYGKDHNRLSRTGVISDMDARPDGSHVVAGAKAGYLMPFGPAKIGPVLGLDYAHAKVDGYTESGDPVLTLNVASQSLKSTTGRLGAEIRGDMAQLHGFLDATVEHEFSGDARRISYSETAAPTIINSWNIGGRKDTYGRVSAGAYVDLVPNVSVNISASSTVRRDHGDEAGAQIGLKAAF